MSGEEFIRIMISSVRAHSCLPAAVTSSSCGGALEVWGSACGHPRDRGTILRRPRTLLHIHSRACRPRASWRMAGHVHAWRAAAEAFSVLHLQDRLEPGQVWLRLAAGGGDGFREGIGPAELLRLEAELAEPIVDGLYRQAHALGELAHV